MRSRQANPRVALIFFGLISVVILVLASYDLYQDEEFDQSPLRSQAMIEHGWISTGSKGSKHYHVRYHFMDRLLRQWTVTNGISMETYDRLHIGDTVPVKYLEGDSIQSRIDWPSEDEYHWHLDEVTLCIGLVVGGLGALIFVAKRR